VPWFDPNIPIDHEATATVAAAAAMAVVTNGDGSGAGGGCVGDGAMRQSTDDGATYGVKRRRRWREMRGEKRATRQSTDDGATRQSTDDGATSWREDAVEGGR
jgi:hypothetical protein